MSSQIKITAFTGGGFKPYIPSIAKLRVDVFREFPFLIVSDVESEVRYLKRLALSKDSMAVVVFDGSKIVGATLGFPLEEESKDAKRPFIDLGLSPSAYFFFGESVLLKPYRGRGMGHHFFDLRENHARHLKRFSHACFSNVIRPKDHPLRSDQYLSLENFWQKRGFVQQSNLIYTQEWQDVGSDEPTRKSIVFWTKHL